MIGRALLALLIAGVWTAAPAGTVWISSSATGIVGAYDAASGAPQGQIAHAFGNPIGLTADRAGDLFISDFSTNDVWKYSVATAGLSLFAALPLGSGVYGTAVDAAGNVWVTARNTNTIYKYSSDGMQLGSATVPTPRGIALNRVNGELYVVSTGGTDAIYQVDPGTMAASLYLTAGLIAPRNIAFDPITHDMFVTNTGPGSADNVGYIERYHLGVDQGRLPGFSFLRGPNSLSFDSTGDVLYFADYYGGNALMSQNLGAPSGFADGITHANGLAYSGVPEPGTIGLMFVGLASLCSVWRRSRRT